MQSPFQIFRKHSKVLMVAVLGMAMISFILLDSITRVSQVSPFILVIIGAALIGGVFWIVGLQGGKGKQQEYGLTGVVLGVAIGLGFMFMTRPKAVVETSVGKISSKELQELIERRNLAVRFMRNSFEAAVPAPPQPQIPRQQLMNLMQRNPQLASAPFVQEMFRQYQAGDQWVQLRYTASFPFEPMELSTGERGTTEREAVLRMLLLKEAKELGVRVSNDAVNEYIQKATNDRMKSSIFNNVRRELGVDKGKLYDVLREEIAAQIVLRLERPRRMRVVTPGEYWAQFRKLNIKQKLEYVPLDVKDFTAQVAAPSEQELRSFFDKYKDKAPGIDRHRDRPPTRSVSDTPAFGLPEQIQIAYFKADFVGVEADVLKELKSDDLTKDEIAKAIKEIDAAVAAAEEKIKSGETKKEVAEKERIDARQADLRKLLSSGGKVSRFDFEIVKHYETMKSVSYTNPAWNAQHPGGPAKKDPFRDMFKTDPNPKKSDAAKPKTIAPTPKPEKGKTNSGKQPAGTKKAADKSAAPKFPDTTPKGKSKAGKSGARIGSPTAIRLAAVGLGPASFTSLLLQPAKKSAPASKGEPSKSKAVVAKRPGKPAKAKTSAKSVPELPPPPPLPEGPPPPPFRELDDTLRSTIRDQLLNQKVLAEIRSRLRKAAAAMESQRVKYLAWLENPERPFDRVAVSKALEQKARELGLVYVITKLFSELEFVDDPARFPMNQAREVADLGAADNRRQQLRSVHELLFPPRRAREKLPASNLYLVIRAEASRSGPFKKTESFFVLWKTAEQEPSIPKFEDKGVRADVLKAWKSMQARPFADKRAKELAKLIRDSKRPMRDVLQGKTVTGQPAGPELRPKLTSEFSWLTDQSQPPDTSAPPLGIHQQRYQISPSEIEGVLKAGEDFRRAIFETLKDGDVGVVPNADKSIYYVVRVLDRNGTTPEGLKDNVEKLLGTQPTAGESQLYGPLSWVLNPLNKSLIDQTIKRLYDKYNVHWNRPADKETE